jgi:hypothetical protein
MTDNPQTPAPDAPDGGGVSQPLPGAWSGPYYPPGPPPPEPDRYRVSTVIGWAILTFVLLIPVLVLTQLTTLQVSNGSAILFLAALLVPAIPITWAVIKMNRAANKPAATPWLGVLIGSALFLILFSGPCVAMLSGMGTA